MSSLLKIKKKNFFLILLIPLFFAFSLILLKYYILGDQKVYIELFKNLKQVAFSEILFSSSEYSYVNNFEKLTVLILWIGAKIGFDKNIYISLLNLFLLSGIYLLGCKYKLSWFFIFLLLTNFYVIVLMTGAERLKIAYIMLIFSILLPRKSGFFLAILSPFAHLQSLLVLCITLIIQYYDDLSQLKISKKNLYFFLIGCVISIIIIDFFQDLLLYKISAYMQIGGFENIFKPIALLIVGMTVTNNRKRMFLSIAPLVIVAYLLGDIRVNMIIFSFLVYLLMIEEKLNHPLIIIILVYFSIKSIPFIKNVILNGNGFNGWLI